MFMFSRRVAVPFLALICAALPAAVLRCELTCLAESEHRTTECTPSSGGAGDHSGGPSRGTGSRPLPPSPQDGCGGHFQAHGSVALAAGKAPVVKPVAEAGLLPASLPVLRHGLTGHLPPEWQAASTSADSVRSHPILRI